MVPMVATPMVTVMFCEICAIRQEPYRIEEKAFVQKKKETDLLNKIRLFWPL
jgi:hypothetical protein